MRVRVHDQTPKLFDQRTCPFHNSHYTLHLRRHLVHTTHINQANQANQSTISAPTTTSAGAASTITIPLPIESYLDWTQPAYFTETPPTFDQHISLPNPLAQPALCASAIDTIRATNLYLHHRPPFAADEILTTTRIDYQIREFCKKYPEYMLPPDRRSLLLVNIIATGIFTRHGDVGKGPTRTERTWAKAYVQFSKMKAFDKAMWLKLTRKDHCAQ
jgi:hypothetical protein